MVFRIILFILITVFYIAYFYKQIQLNHQGIQTNRLAKGNKPKQTKTIEIALLIATYTTAFVQYLSILFSKYMVPILTPIAVTIIGLMITTAGAFIFIISINTMKDNWRAGVDEQQNTKIVTNGIYKYSRNPDFVGFDLLHIGTSLGCSNILIIVFALVTIVFSHLQILEEEKYLPTIFGEEYLEYKKKTPRYLFF